MEGKTGTESRGKTASRIATRFSLALAAVAVASGASGSVAAAVTVGANLARPADAQYGCEFLPTTDAFGNRAFFPTGVTSCTYVGTQGLGGPAEIAQTPSGGGVVTAVRVKVGPVTGPMQVTVLQATSGTQTPFACCFYAGASQVFTPAPNAITTIPVRLVVRNDINPAFGQTVDYLAISVLAPGVPIPAEELGNPGNPFQPGALAFFPFVSLGQERADGAGVIGIVPLLQADITPLCPVGGALNPACTPPIAVGNGRVIPGGLVLPLGCNITVDCVGLLRLVNRPPALAAIARKTPKVVYATARFHITAGVLGTIHAKLTRAGAKLLRHHHRLRAWAVITGTGAVAALNGGRVTITH